MRLLVTPLFLLVYWGSEVVVGAVEPDPTHRLPHVAIPTPPGLVERDGKPQPGSTDSAPASLAQTGSTAGSIANTALGSKISSQIGSSGAASAVGSSEAKPSSVASGAAQPTQSTQSTQGPLKLANQLLGMSPKSCLAQGGGCGVFNLTIDDCQDDHCACEDSATLAGMVCGQCNADQKAIALYNQYLQACQKAGWAHPSDTVTVSLGALPVALATSPDTTQTLTASKPSTAAAAKASSTPLSGGQDDDNNDPEPPDTDDPVDDIPTTSGANSTTADKGISASKHPATTVALQQDDGTTSAKLGSSATGRPTNPTGAMALVATNSSPLSTGSPTGTISGSRSISGSISGSASDDSEDPPSPSDSSDTVISFNRTVMSSMTVTVSTPSSHISSLKDSSAGTTASNTASGSAKSSQPSDLALGATLRFFSFDIDSKCDDSCSVWKNLANTCKQDRCICTRAGVSSAASCSQCLGSTTHGEPYQQQIGLYNAFTSNCTAYVDGPTAAAAGVGTSLSGYDIVPSATNTPASELRSTGRPTPTKANAEATLTETKTTGGQGVARSAYLLPYAVSIMLGWLVLEL